MTTVSCTSLTTYTSNTSTSSYSTSSITPSANALVLAIVQTSNNEGSYNVTGNGLTWVEVAAPGDTSNRVRVMRAMGTSPSAGAVTISGFSLGNPAFGIAVHIVELTNVDTSGANGAGAVVQEVDDNYGGATPVSSPRSLTLSAFGSTDNATLGVFANDSNRTFTVGTGFTSIATTAHGSTWVMVTEFRNDNDTSVDASWTGGDADLIGVAIEVKAGSPPAPYVGGLKAG